MDVIKYLPKPLIYIAAITVIILYLFNLMKSNSIERLLLNREVRTLKVIINEIILFFIVAVLSIIFKFAYRLHLPLATETVLLIIIWILFAYAVFPDTKFPKHRNLFFNAIKRRMNVSDIALKLLLYFALTLVFLYLLFSTMSDILTYPQQKSDLKNIYNIFVGDPRAGLVIIAEFLGYFVFMYMIFRPMIELYFRFFRLYIYHVELKVTVSIGSEVFENMYLFAPTYGKMIMIGEQPYMRDCEHVIAISKDKISHISINANKVVLGNKQYLKDRTDHYRF